MTPAKDALGAGEQIRIFQDFFETRLMGELMEAARLGKTSILLHFPAFSEFNPELAELLLDQPEEVIKAAEIAIEQLDISAHKPIRVRVIALPKPVQLRIRDMDPSATENRLISIYGMIRRKSEIKPKIIMARFECPACGSIIPVPQKGDKVKEPNACSCGRKGRFRVLNEDKINQISLVLEETPDSVVGGSDLKKIHAVLGDDLAHPNLINRIQHGNVIRLNGILKHAYVGARDGGKLTELSIFLQVNSVEFLEETWDDIIINDEDEKQISLLASDKHILDRLSSTVFKGIYGFESEKKAILLQQFGGVRSASKNIINRGNVHILLIGDTGTSKSTLLKAIQKVTPRARYVSGRGASGVGLTAAVVKDELLGGYTLEAGALALANGGLCLLDELDKVGEDDRKSLNEALEEQTITINKANIQATLKAETSVLAAANPKFGRFNPYDDMYKQFDLDPTLVNRFDLVFSIKDMPAPDKDRQIAKTMMMRQRQTNPFDSETDIPDKLIKKYIAHAKKIHPLFPEHIEERIVDFFVRTRAAARQAETGVLSIPISARQIESIRRLSQARARSRLAKEVTEDDVDVAIELVTYFLKQVGVDPETGEVDIDKISTGVSASKHHKISIVKEIISSIEPAFGGIAPLFEVMKACTNKNIGEGELEEIVRQLLLHGDLMEPRSGFLKTL